MRAQPFYCPYCGEQDFAPVDDGDSFVCDSCARCFRIEFLGLRTPT